MIVLVLAVFLTLSISAFCSLLEAMLLSSSVADIQALKKRSPKQGSLMRRFKKEIDETSSAILALNTIANTLGSLIVGSLVASYFSPNILFGFSVSMTLAILLFSEILPKNIGVLYRKELLPYLVYPLYFVRSTMLPISWFCKKAVRILIPREQSHDDHTQDILLLAEKSEQDGNLTRSERDIISNALKLDDIQLSEIMTPRTVVSTVDKNMTVSEVFTSMPSLLFSRMPVYEDNTDNIVGYARRKDIFKAKASNLNKTTIGDLMHKVLFVPETITAEAALKQLLREHQKMGVVIDEFGSLAGVVTLEDIFEHILGKEIFEKDDLAVDMRELAMKKKRIHDRKRLEKKK